MNDSSVHGVMLTDDLIFFSRVAATARAHGLGVRQARTVEGLLRLVQEHSPAGLLIDLQNETLDLPQLMEALTQANRRRPRVVAFGSHVEKAALTAARDAGCEGVMPRSQFVHKLEGDLRQWLAPSQEPLADQGA